MSMGRSRSVPAGESLSIYGDRVMLRRICSSTASEGYPQAKEAKFTFVGVFLRLLSRQKQ